MTAIDVLTPVDVKQPEENDARFWSVTTIIGVLDKPALIYWTAEETAKAATLHRATWESIEESSGTSEAIKWLTGARFRAPKDELGAADFGTGVHEMCEQYALSGIKPTVDPAKFRKDVDAAQACLDQFDRWLNTFSPVYQAAEVTVYSPTYGYAGTSDAFLTIDGVRFIGDYKVSKKANDRQGKPSPIYPETALQLAAYRHAEMAAVWRPRRFEQMRRRYYLLALSEREQAVPVPEVDTGLGIKITPEHCFAYPVRCDERVHEAFLYALECARWSFQDCKTAVGDALIAPEVA